MRCAWAHALGCGLHRWNETTLCAAAKYQESCKPNRADCIPLISAVAAAWHQDYDPRWVAAFDMVKSGVFGDVDYFDDLVASVNDIPARGNDWFLVANDFAAYMCVRTRASLARASSPCPTCMRAPKPQRSASGPDRFAGRALYSPHAWRPPSGLVQCKRWFWAAPLLRGAGISKRRWTSCTRTTTSGRAGASCTRRGAANSLRIAPSSSTPTRSGTSSRSRCHEISGDDFGPVAAVWWGRLSSLGLQLWAGGLRPLGFGYCLDGRVYIGSWSSVLPFHFFSARGTHIFLGRAFFSVGRVCCSGLSRVRCQ
jgi:hypothetical protein